MKLILETLTYKTTEETDILDITPDVSRCVRGAGIAHGFVNLFIPGSTGALTTIEFESGVINDLKDAIERMAPKNIPYAHDLRWGDGNGYSHVRAALLGPSLQVPIIAGNLALGTWQQIVLCDFDNRPRQRRVLVQLVGEV